MISPGMRGGDGAAILAGTPSAGRGADPGREPAAGMPLVTTGFAAVDAFLNIGAGCEPDCMNSTLIRIAVTAKAPTMKPTASRGLHPIMRKGYQPPRPSISSSTRERFPRPARAVALRTFLHRDACRCFGVAGHEPLDHGRRSPSTPAFAAHRQTECDPRS